MWQGGKEGCIMRENGYYWVKENRYSDWEVAWNYLGNFWVSCNFESTPECDINTINDTRIKNPDGVYYPDYPDNK